MQGYAMRRAAPRQMYYTAPAAQASPSPLPQGKQWLGVAFVAATAIFFYWGTRPETAEDKAAYQAMKRRRLAMAR